MTANTPPADLRQFGVETLKPSLATAGWLAAGPGWLVHADEINIIRDHLKDTRTKAQGQPFEALAGAPDVLHPTAIDQPPEPVFHAMPIDTNHWTVSRETFTPTRDTNDRGLSN